MIRKMPTLTILFALLCSPALLAQDQWLHLRVSGSNEAEAFSFNLPLAAIQTMLPTLAGRGLQEGRATLGHADISVADLRAMWNSLRGQGDFQIAEIQEKDMHLRVAMEGDNLIARTVEGSDKQIHIQIPATVVDALLSGEGEEVNLQAAVDALAAIGTSEVVKVQDGERNIELWIDRNAAGN